MNLSGLLVNESVSHINESKAFVNSFVTGILALTYLKNSMNESATGELLALVEKGKIDEYAPLYIITDISADEMYFFSSDIEILSTGIQEIGSVVDDVYGVSHTLYLDNPYGLITVDIEKARHLDVDLEYTALQIKLSKILCNNPFDIPDYCIVSKPSDFIQHINKYPLGYLRIMLVK